MAPLLLPNYGKFSFNHNDFCSEAVDVVSEYIYIGMPQWRSHKGKWIKTKHTQLQPTHTYTHISKHLHMHIIHYSKNYYIILGGIHGVICWILKSDNSHGNCFHINSPIYLHLVCSQNAWLLNVDTGNFAIPPVVKGNSQTMQSKHLKIIMMSRHGTRPTNSIYKRLWRFVTIYKNIGINELICL